MNGNLLTHTLLFVIAVLLLVLVIQNSVYHSMIERPVLEQATAPMPQPKAGMMEVEMVFHALKAFPEGCAGKKTLAECNSPAAETVKLQIAKIAESKKSIREVFDGIISQWSENVLTEEALQIRKQRRSGQ